MPSYHLIRSNRKTLAIYITPDSQVEVRAPRRLPQGEIDRFVAIKSHWIAQALARQQARLDARSAFAPTTLRFLGDTIPITFTGGEAAFSPVSSRDCAIPSGDCALTPSAVELPPGDWAVQKPLVKALYRRAAKEYLPGRLALLAEKTGRSPTAVTITDARTRWGSCSGRGRISLSWRLMFAPPEAVDYVLIHELSHLWEMNHSPRFWAKVAAFCPDWHLQRENLHRLGRELNEEDWI